MEQFHPSIPLESTASRPWSGCWFRTVFIVFTKGHCRFYCG
uniref:Uncharacterized protein n=1 Tax=Anguilla anguilla TaxID=7936 RepID=A0A0E9TA27_ANGAN